MPTAYRLPEYEVVVDAPLRHPLDRLRGTIRRFVAADGLLAAGLFVLGWFWGGLAADFGLFKLTGFDWVQDAPWWVRGAALAALGVGLVVLVAGRVAARLATDMSYPALALVLEKRFPAVLGDRLITAVELADVAAQARYGYSADMIRGTIAEARAAVARVPVGDVFHWRRLEVKAVALVGLGLLAVGTSFGLSAGFGGPRTAGRFAAAFADVAAVWGERNLLLKDTPWPRRAHVELVGFPASGELRVGKDARPPVVRAKAYRFVVAAPGRRDGWRPLTFADLRRLAARYAAVGDRQYHPWMDPSAFPDAAAVDDLAAAAGDAADVLSRLAARPGLSRVVRELAVPADLTLTYRGAKTSGTVALTREPTGEFAGEVAGLKESVRFRVTGDDFATATRRITLVPPPVLVKLTRTEWQPAYLYHPPPAGAGPAALKGRRQVFRDKELSLTGDRSVFTVPGGSAVAVRGAADKPLKRVAVAQKGGPPVGPVAAAADPADPAAFTLPIALPAGATGAVELDLTLVDPDDVTAARGLVVQIADDLPPQVEVAVDVLRRQGNSYLCTPIAYVPFVPDSVVRDDTGLGDVAYEATATRLEGATLAGLQLQAAVGVWAGAPLTAGPGAWVAPAAAVYQTAQLAAGGGRKAFQRAAVRRFADDYAGLPRHTPDGLAAALAGAVDPDRPGVVKQVKFSDPTADVFDLRAAFPDLGRSDPDAVPPRYRVDLDVTAADVNVDTGPKRGRNLEPIRLLVVPEADLLAEMSKDEEGLIGKLDDVLRQLRAGQAKLAETADRVRPPAPPADLVLAAAVRAADAALDVGKGRDGVQTLVAEYRRLRREAEVNRLNPAVAGKWEADAIGPFEAALRAEFPAAERAVAAFQAPLAAGGRPDDALAAAAQAAVADLIAKLDRVRAAAGEAVSLSKLRDELRLIIDRQKEVAAALDRLGKRMTEALFAPKIYPPAGPLAVAAGGKLTVTHPIDWNVFEGGQLTVRIEPPAAGGLTAPAEVVVTDDKAELVYELTAGQVPGDYQVRVIPSAGEPLTVTVTVK